MYLGRKSMNTNGVKVYAMPRMRKMLSENAPWSQLVSLKNVLLEPISDGVDVRLNPKISVTPFLVPHRDEFSETVGFRVKVDQRTAVYIPDIDKWEKWNRDIIGRIGMVDIALIDGTLYQDGELPGRNMSESTPARTPPTMLTTIPIMPPDVVRA